MKKAAIILWAFLTGPVFAGGLDPAEPKDMLNGWMDSVVSGDADRVADILAPEFQIMRSKGYKGTEYAYRNLPIASAPSATEIVATQDGDHMVVRYYLEIDETIDGVTIQKRAPRLTTFRRIDGMWFVSSHANFALPVPEE